MNDNGKLRDNAEETLNSVLDVLDGSGLGASDRILVLLSALQGHNISDVIDHARFDLFLSRIGLTTLKPRG